MWELYQNKYNINALRLQGWDYSYGGLYFFTICTQERKNWFGQIRNNMMGLSSAGLVVWEEWLKTAAIRQNVRLDEFIVMPNHVHGIIEIHNIKSGDEATPRLYTGRHRQMAKISPTPGSLSTIIGSIKSICARRIRQSGQVYFQWQPRFYDHIIRVDTESLEKIRHYIKYNPSLWHRDRNNLDNLKK